MMVDESIDRYDEGCYTLTRIHHVDGHIIRVRIRDDNLPYQALAVAEVLSTSRTWTVLLDEPRTSWYPAPRDFVGDTTALVAVADRLITRARTVLTIAANAAPTGPTTVG